jgi:short-subunit dehydrogenase
MKPPGLVEISPERCARAAIRALDKNRALVIPGLLIRLILFLGVKTPRFILRLFYAPVARLLRKKQLALPAAARPESGQA